MENRVVRQQLAVLKWRHRRRGSHARFLITRGALLDKNLHAHLEDFVSTKEIDRESIERRIENINPKLCTVELRPVLPPAVFDELAESEFEPIRRSLGTVLSHWRGEQKR